MWTFIWGLLALLAIIMHYKMLDTSAVIKELCLWAGVIFVIAMLIDIGGNAGYYEPCCV